MGQSNSNSKDSVFQNFDTLSISKDKLSYVNNGSIYAVEDRSCFFSRCCSSDAKADISTSRWKDHMIEQLNSLKLDVWPKLMIKVIKHYKDKTSESSSQAEVIMAYKHSFSLRTKNASLVSVLSRQRDDSFSIRSKASSQNSFQFSEEKSCNEMVHELLENCALLEEKVYDKRSKENWIDRSFNIQVAEDTVAVNSSLKELEAARNINHKELFCASEKRKASPKKQSYTKKYIEKYRNNTFITRLPNRQETNQAGNMYDLVSKYKAVTDTIDKHIKQPQNVFYRLISRFERFFYQTYFPITDKWRSKQISEAQLAAYCERATMDLQQFIKILSEGVSLFYRLDFFQAEGETLNGDSLFNKDNVISFITSVVFTETIYITIFDLYKLKESQVEESYQKNLKYCKKLNPQDFGTADEYCLNERTIAYFEKKNINHLRSSQKLVSLKGSYDFKAINASSSSPGSFSRRLISPESKLRSSPLKKYLPGSLESRDLNNEGKASPKEEEEEKFSPYREAIEVLSTLKYRKNPIQKLKTIVKVAELLTESIESFYGEIGFHRRDKLDADQTLSIFMYIVAHSNLDNLIVNCKIIQEFTTPNILNSVSGYYAITLEACIRCICAMTFQDRVSSDHLSISLKGFVHSVGRFSLDRLSDSGN